MEAGHLALVNYGEAPPVWHTRLLLGRVDGNVWQILTPDLDRHPEQMDGLSPDFVDFEYLGAGGNPPARIPPHQIYGFAPLDPATIAHHMTQGRLEANAQRLAMGLPLAGAIPVPPAPPVAPGPPAPPPPPPGILGAGPAIVPPAVVPGAVTYAWVAIEEAGGWKKGDVLCVEPNVLPAGHLVLGDRGIVPDPRGVGQGCFVRRVPHADVGQFALDDLRTLPVRFDAQGVRRREFNDAVAHMVDGVPQGGGLQLEGPSTALNIVKNLRDQNFTPSSFHEFWMRTADIPRGDRSTYEHECLSRIMEAMITVDQLNIGSLQSSELIMRRLQVIREAHRISPSAPDYSSADHFMGWKWKKATQGIDAGLAAHVAGELKNEAAISKEARKAREEAAARRRPPTKQGGGGEGK